MINQQLLDFIKNQLQKGLSKEIILNQLLSNGWTNQDVQEAFNTINPPISGLNPSIGSTISMPSDVTQPITQNIINEKHSFRNPSWGRGLLFIFLASIISSLVFTIIPLLKSSSEIFSIGNIKMTGILAGFLFGSLFMGSVILNLVTRILKIVGHSIPKALVFSAILQITATVLFGIFTILLPKDFVSATVSAISIIVSVWFFCRYYQTTFLRTLAVFAIGIIFAGIFSVVLTIISFVVGISIFSFLMSPFNGTSNNIKLPESNIIKQEQNLPTVITPIDLVEKDCGTAYPDNLKDLVFTDADGGTTKIKDYDKDLAITCMGNALLNNCQKAVLKVESKNGTIHTEEIIGVNSVGCTLKVTYQNVNANDVDQKQYENSYLQCDYPSSDSRIELKNGCSTGFIPLSTAACNFFGIKDSPAHMYINSIGKMMLGALMSPDEIKCSGDMIEKITKASAPEINQPSNSVNIILSLNKKISFDDFDFNLVKITKNNKNEDQADIIATQKSTNEIKNFSITIGEGVTIMFWRLDITCVDIKDGKVSLNIQKIN